MLDRLPFERVYVVDTEYRPVPGDLPDPVHCVVYKELRSGAVISQWTGDGGGQIPYDTGPSSLFVAHYSVAEWLAHIALGRPLPKYVIDTYAEARVLRNGLPGTKYGLTDVAERYGIATISKEAKRKYQDRAASDERFSDQEKAHMIRYCLSDVETTAELFLRMLPEILAPKFGLQHALIRGRYMIAAALMQYAGIPVDVELLSPPPCPLARTQAGADQGCRPREIRLLRERVVAAAGERLSEAEFRQRYGTEEQCRAALFRLRWGKGWACPGCGHGGYAELRGRAVYQCNRCKHQVGLTAGTVFHWTKLPLTAWFLAIYHLTQSKGGMSSVELARRLGTRQPTAWLIKHKLMAAMVAREAEKPRLAGRVEVDDAYLGGERSGGKRGRGAAGKTPFVAAVGNRFNDNRFAQLLTRMGLVQHWPRTEFGRLSTAQKVFKSKSELYPELRPLYELKQTLDKMKSFDLAIGKDGRHRAESLSPFATDTGRNAPNGFAYALARWTRHLIKPGPGMAVVYTDYTCQEIYIAAMLSQDPKMIEAINSGDPYMYFAKETKLAPSDATKYTHADLRNKLKPFMLGINYGMIAKGIANKVGTSFEDASYVLLPKHHGLFRVYWEDAFSRLYTAVDRKHVRSRFGWHMHVTAETKYTSLLNHPIQTAGADVLRLACIGLTEIGIKVVAPVHDAVLTECRIEEVDEHIRSRAADDAPGSQGRHRHRDPGREFRHPMAGPLPRIQGLGDVPNHHAPIG